MAVAVVEYKYTPDQMPVEELKRTFAARQGLLDLVLRHLRAQAQAASLSSFLLIGPRGSGKTTLVLMLCQSMREDPELSAAWLPLRFREEQFEVCSLRDMLAAAVRGLADEEVPGAEPWSSRVEQAADDEESQALALAALKDLAKSQGKRLVLFVENLNLLMARAFDDTSQATLRRLLMVDPFLMIVGTAVQTFEEVEGYDKALFNYFHPLHLERLTDEQMCELLTRRAEYDGNADFIERLGEHRPKLRALSRLTGGNPRFLLMVYEILSEGGITSAVEILRRLVDELTPLLKHVLEALPPQQAKILDAILRAGGTATPAALAQATRLKLNVVTAQLRRLKDNRMVEVLGGGKGQTAYYTVPDQLFCTWYQMRYVRQNRRRIELFVEVIRVWFETEERLAHLRRFAELARKADGRGARSLAESAEYFAAALQGTDHDDAARRLMIQSWLHAGGVTEAAMAFADKPSTAGPCLSSRAVGELRGFSSWCCAHHLTSLAVGTARKAAEEHPQDLQAQIAYLSLIDLTRQTRLYLDQLERCLALPISEPELDGLLLRLRFLTKLLLSKSVEFFRDRRVLQVLVQFMTADYPGVIAECSDWIESGELGRESLASVLTVRAAAKMRLDDRAGARADLIAAVNASGFTRTDVGFLISFVGPVMLGPIGRQLALNVVAELIEIIDVSTRPSQVEFLASAVHSVAEPENREAWPCLVRRMCERMPTDSAKSVEYLVRVGEVLEGTDRSVLDGLPPEQRALAMDLLEAFEPEGSESDEDGVQNESASRTEGDCHAKT